MLFRVDEKGNLQRLKEKEKPISRQGIETIRLFIPFSMCDNNIFNVANVFLGYSNNCKGTLAGIDGVFIAEYMNVLKVVEADFFVAEIENFEIEKVMKNNCIYLCFDIQAFNKDTVRTSVIKVDKDSL